MSCHRGPFLHRPVWPCSESFWSKSSSKVTFSASLTLLLFQGRPALFPTTFLRAHLHTRLHLTKSPFTSAHDWMTWCVQLPPVCHRRYQCAFCLRVLVVSFRRREVDLREFSSAFATASLFSAALRRSSLRPEKGTCHLKHPYDI